MKSDNSGDSEAQDFLDRVRFDEASNVLTRRQVEILVLRERGYSQPAIADLLGTSRANVTNIEASARDNVEKAKETVRIVNALQAPILVSIPAGTDIYNVPNKVYEACNQANIKVPYSAPELMKRVLDEAEGVVNERTIETSLTVSVDDTGEITILSDNPDVE